MAKPLARIAVIKALNRNVERVFNPDRKDTHWGNGSSRETISVLVYVDISRQVGDKAHHKMFANPEGCGSSIQPI
jgi:hypothetical protein